MISRQIVDFTWELKNMARAGDPVSVRLQIEIHEIHKFVWVCDQLATFLDRKQVADRFELSRQASSWSATLSATG